MQGLSQENIARPKEIRSSDGLTLAMLVAGEETRPPVILLHGFPESAHSWRHQVPALAAAGYSVWVPNLRGYPPSGISHEQGAYRLRQLVDDVHAVVNATGHERATIAGHDWGGIIAYAYANAHPARLDKLVILNAPHMQLYTEKIWRSSQLFRSAYVGFFQLPVLPEHVLSAADFFMIRHMFRSAPYQRGAFTDEDIERYVSGLRQPGALKAALDYYRENLRPGAMDLARPLTIETPLLVIWGMHDPALGAFLLDGLERFANRLTIHRIQQASHWVQNEAPEEVNRVLLDFLGK
jgi:epoxide hydrolase 4